MRYCADTPWQVGHGVTTESPGYKRSLGTVKVFGARYVEHC